LHRKGGDEVLTLILQEKDIELLMKGSSKKKYVRTLEKLKKSSKKKLTNKSSIHK
jgi:hypothetical protein